MTDGERPVADDLAIQRMRAKLDPAKGGGELVESVRDAVDAWFTYQEARGQIGTHVMEMMKAGFDIGRSVDALEQIGAFKVRVEDIAAEAKAFGAAFLQSQRFVDALIDEILDPAIAAAEDQMIADAEQESGSCRHEQARKLDGAPDDALFLPCTFVDMFGIQSGDIVDDLKCPTCDGQLKFRTWRPRGDVRPMQAMTDTGVPSIVDIVGPWFQCCGCEGWGNFGYKMI